MKSNSILTVAFAVASLMLLSPAATYAKITHPANSQTRTIAPSANMAHRTAGSMVPAEATLTQNMDAEKLQTGSDFTAVLTQSAKLKNGDELPRGTTLIGKVERDSQPGAKSVLTLRFTQAKLKDGHEVPIRATIVAVAPPAATDQADYFGAPVMTPWDGRSLAFDQIGALSGVDLHSRIAGKDSGTFVSKRKDVRLSGGSQLALAIGARGNA